MLKILKILLQYLTFYTDIIVNVIGGFQQYYK